MSVSYGYLASSAGFNASFVCANYTPVALAQVDMNAIDYSLLTPLIQFDASVNPITRAVSHTLCLFYSDHVPGFMLDMINGMVVHSTTVEAMSVALQEIFENPAIFVKTPFFIHFQFFGYELNVPEVLLRQSSESFMRTIATYGPYLGYYSNLGAAILAGILLLSFLSFVTYYEIFNREDSSRTIFSVFNNSLVLGIAGVFIQSTSLTVMTHDLLYRFYDQHAIRMSDTCSDIGLCCWQFSFVYYTFRRSEPELRSQFPSLFPVMKFVVQFLFPSMLACSVISSVTKAILVNRPEMDLAVKYINLACGAVETIFDLLLAFCCSRSLKRLGQSIGVNAKVKTISAHGLFASASQLIAYTSAILAHVFTGIDGNSACYLLSIYFLVFAFTALFSMKVRLHFMKGNMISHKSTSTNKDSSSSRVEKGARTTSSSPLK
ncbi:hypothetical protein BJ741DRAFT_590108 [Chytriomyces cf. hyalinus JEL632]|nr:hypothetical protein BJ741DRAFT_590108 [Chytriomyces cf. hyalinus JEL632]